MGPAGTDENTPSPTLLVSCQSLLSSKKAIWENFSRYFNITLDQAVNFEEWILWLNLGPQTLIPEWWSVGSKLGTEQLDLN